MWMLLEEGIIYSRILFLYCLPKPFFPKERKNMRRRKYQFKCYLSLTQKFTIGFSQPTSFLPSFNYFGLIIKIAAKKTEKKSIHGT